MDDGKPFPFELPHRTRTRTASLRARREAWHPLNARPTRTCVGVPSHLHARTHRSSSSLRVFYLPALAGRPRQLHGPSATSRACSRDLAVISRRRCAQTVRIRFFRTGHRKMDDSWGPPCASDLGQSRAHLGRISGNHLVHLGCISAASPPPPGCFCTARPPRTRRPRRGCLRRT